jgi:hypothetical protein
MTPFERELHRIAGALREEGARFALVGGLAVSVRTSPRFTRDVDLVVAVADDAAAERITASLVRRGWVTLYIAEQSKAGRLAQVRLAERPGSPASAFVDLLFASSGIEPEIVAAAQETDVAPGLRLPVARLGHLVVQKVLARDDVRRPQDIVDLRALLAVASSEDLALAREAARLVALRGFARDRDPAADLERLLHSEGAG